MLLGDGTDAAAGSSADTRTIVAALAAGIAAGILAGLFGVGGGILFVPALAALGLGQLAAEATSLVAVIPTVLVGAYRQHGYGNVRIKTACILGVSSVAGVYVGVLVALAADESHLRKLFGVLLLATAVAARVAVGEGAEEGLTLPARRLRAGNVSEGSRCR